MDGDLACSVVTIAGPTLVVEFPQVILNLNF
jgi:hypothetical protein